jgi:UDP-GlcNAc:undecaprenyl-phosphate GlcNAc-1-phosphate transferase
VNAILLNAIRADIPALLPIAFLALPFGLTVVLTPLCRDLFRRIGVLDYPDQTRKLHAAPIPHAGGIPIAISYLITCGIWLKFVPGAPSIPLRWPFMLGASIVLATGLIDDIRGLPGRVKMATNAFNLIDGLDGLAAGLGLFAVATMTISALFQHNAPMILLTVPLAGCLLGFLRYNFTPASIFLGDSGSLSIGFLLGCYGAIWSQKSATLLGMSAPVLALAVPLLDTGLAVVRRTGGRRSIFTPDRRHLHHLLLARGLNQREAVILLYGVCGLAAAISLLLTVPLQHRAAGLVVVVFCVGSLLAIRSLRDPAPLPDPALERHIARRFEEIENVGWFPRRLEEGSIQLRILEEFIEPGPGMRILDAGCARGRYSRALVPSGARLFGIDRASLFAGDARTNVPEASFTQGTVSALPFADGAFDAVFCIDCLQHIPATLTALDEMARVLKPGGVLVIIDRNLQGLHPGTGVPNFLYKRWAELRGKWMYAADFGFREHWFWPWKLAADMRRHFRSVGVRYVHENRGRAAVVYRRFPFLASDAAWIGRK